MRISDWSSDVCSSDLEPPRKLLDALLQQPAVGFQLGFTRAAQADRAAALALQVGPAAHQARGHVAQLGQFDLQLALGAARALREDVEDQAGAIDHAPLQHLRSEEHTSELHALMRISYAVFC